MIPEPIRELLDELYERYDTPGFIEDDPISVPHGFTRREDIEIAGFLAATIAWGNRRSIVRNGRKLMKLMDRSLRLHDERIEERAAAAARLRPQNIQRGRLHRFYRRLARHLPARRLAGRLFRAGIRRNGRPADRAVALSHGLLERGSPPESREAPLVDRPGRLVQAFVHVSQMDGPRRRTGRRLRTVEVDSPAALYLPLDVHTGHMGRALGLLARKQNDWKAVEEITASLRTLDASDPVKYDFALFGAGIDGFLK